MSPRAACRLERLGFEPVYDYTAGKADWLAAGFPSEGKPHPARVLDAADRHPVTCGPDETVAAVVVRLADVAIPSCAVVDDTGVLLGRFRSDRVGDADNERVEAVAEPGPTTVRADADLAAIQDRMRDHHVDSLFVTTPEGVLLGELRAASTD